MPVDPSIKQLIDVAVFAADEKNGEDIVALDVAERFYLADAFVIVSGESERQVMAIADNIEDKLRQIGSKPIQVEGRSGGRWVLMDFDGVIVHVQHTEEREFYQIERLWKDSPRIELAELPVQVGS